MVWVPRIPLWKGLLTTIVEYRSPETFNPRESWRTRHFTKLSQGTKSDFSRDAFWESLGLIWAHVQVKIEAAEMLTYHQIIWKWMQIWIWKILKDMRLHKSCWLAGTKLIPLHNIKWYPVLLTHKKARKKTPARRRKCPESSSMTLMQKVKVSRKTCVAAGWHRTQL